MNATNPPQYSISEILEKFWAETRYTKDVKLAGNFTEAEQAINQLIYTQVLELIPEKLTDNVAFTIGEGEMPLTQFQIGYNQAIDDMTERLKAKYIGGSDE